MMIVRWVRLEVRLGRLLRVALFGLAVTGCGILRSLWITPTPTAVQPGEWIAAAQGLGDLVFEVAADGTTIALVSVHFKQLTCGREATNEQWLHGDWQPDAGNRGAITGGQFTLSPQASGRSVLTFGGWPPDFSLFDEMTVSGQFDGTGRRASGSWKIARAGEVCSGEWVSPKCEAPARSESSAAPLALGEGFSDTFDDNSQGWFVGDYKDRFVTGSRAIVEGKYRWEAQAHQPARFSSIPQMKPLADFTLTVEARRVSGDPGSLYGLLFRRLDRNNFYLFQINDEQSFTVERLDQDEWVTLIEWNKTAAIRPGQVNRLAVRGQGARFEFFVNGKLVGEMDDDEFSRGVAGLVIGIPEAGSQAVFEFDNFEVGEVPAAP